MHHIGRFEESALRTHPTFEGHSEGYSCVSLVDHAVGSVHTGLTMNELAPGGTIHPHVHSFEEGFYILAGEAVVTINGSSYLLGPGDFAAVKVGTPHAWHAASSSPVRWLGMAAPQPKPHGALRDTFFLKDRTVPSRADRLESGSAQRQSPRTLRRHSDPRAERAEGAWPSGTRRRIPEVDD